MASGYTKARARGKETHKAYGYAAYTNKEEIEQVLTYSPITDPSSPSSSDF